jgi:hypothetical protein
MRALQWRVVFLLGAIVSTGLISAPSAMAEQIPKARLVPMLVSTASFGDDLSDRLLGAHNRERMALGLPLLRWNPALATAAASYGPTLAALGGVRHSPRAPRPGQSENLWMGSRSAFTPEQMVGNWIEEKNQFRSGTFPNVSLTGNWADVGHYTTLIWPTTTEVGCAIQRTGSWDFLICRYSPRGNADGIRVG